MRVSVDEALDEAVVERLVHIDALDAAAALAGIEERAVDEVLDRVIEIGVGAHIGRVLAAELEAERREGAGRGALDRAAAGDRAGEVDVIDRAPSRSASRSSSCVEDEVLEQALRQAGRVEGLWKRSPTSSVCAACFRITALPAISAGTIVLTAVR